MGWQDYADGQSTNVAVTGLLANQLSLVLRRTEVLAEVDYFGQHLFFA